MRLVRGKGGEGGGGKLEDKGGIPTWAIKWLRAEPGSMRIHAFKLVFKCQESNISPARFFFYSDSVRIVCSYIERLVESGARSVWFLNIFFCWFKGLWTLSGMFNSKRYKSVEGVVVFLAFKVHSMFLSASRETTIKKKNMDDSIILYQNKLLRAPSWIGQIFVTILIRHTDIFTLYL